MRDSLSETTNELMIERNKIKLLSEATVSNEYTQELKSLTDHNIGSLSNTQNPNMNN